MLFHPQEYSGSISEQYDQLYKQLISLIQDENNQIANLANSTALLTNFLTDINWVGFYLVDKDKKKEGIDELVLGPFQGLPACIRIPFGKGVCGKVATETKMLVVPNVHEFPGHIACDSRSVSEIVIPIINDNKLIGVLDIDSPMPSRFDENALLLDKFAKILSSHLNL